MHVLQGAEAFKNKLDVISGVNRAGKNATAVVLTEEESSELLAIFLHVCSAVKLSTHRAWWSNKVPKFLQNFMDTLKHCVLASRYVGKKELERLRRIAGNAAADVTQVKRHKEKLDSFAARYKNPASPQVGTCPSHFIP